METTYGLLCGALCIECVGSKQRWVLRLSLHSVARDTSVSCDELQFVVRAEMCEPQQLLLAFFVLRA
jgi:hypothetical protein